MKIAAAGFALCLSLAHGAFADQALNMRFIEALSLDEVFEILADEGIEAGEEMALEDPQISPSPAWSRRLEGIYTKPKMASIFGDALSETSNLDAAIPALEFFESELGQRIVKIELEARRAIGQDEIEEAAASTVEDMIDANDPRLELYNDFIEVNDLIDGNVSGALNSNLAFYRGMATHEQFAETLTDSFMTSSVWEQEPEIRAEMEAWVMNFSTLAYSGLEADEMQQYIDISRSEAGQKLNAALFAGFDDIFELQSYDLGRATAEFSIGEDT